ncbi:MAG: GNAT family N-acetyltransferase [Bacillota bacterium]
MRLPPITSDLVRRLQGVWVKERRTRHGGSMEQPGNPSGIEMRTFGGALAVRSRRLPSSPWLNRCINLTADDLPHVEEILKFYREAGLTGWLEIAPGTSSPELFAALARGGAHQTGFHTVTYGLPTTEVPPPAPGVAVRPVEREELDRFLEAHMIGFGAGPEIAPGFRFFFGLPDWHLYLATVDGVLAGTAILCTYDGVGYMAAASTLPEWRGRGVQTALLHHRIAEAARMGCDLLMGQCDFGTSSHRNQQACGLFTAYTKAVWVTSPA